MKTTNTITKTSLTPDGDNKNDPPLRPRARPNNYRSTVRVATFVLFVGIVTAVTVITVRRNSATHQTATPTYETTSVAYGNVPPSVSKTIAEDDPLPLATTNRVTSLTQIVSETFGDDLSGEPQRRALNWLTKNDTRQLPPDDASRVVQRYSLAVVYFATGGEDWTRRSGWTKGQHECQWDGVVCSASSEVLFLELGTNNLSGSLPREIFGVSSLRGIDLVDNGITGSIPSSIARLVRLERLDLAGNSFFGPLHPRLYEMTALKDFSVAYNLLTGKISPDLAGLTNLYNFDVAINLLSGTVPDNVTSMRQLQKLWLDGNSFTGLIPEDIGSLTNLTDLTLSVNNFTGPIPHSMGNLKSVEYLRFDYNDLTGTVPSSFGRLTNLLWLFGENNHIVGVVPRSVCDLGFYAIAMDCGGDEPEIDCSCCTQCCYDLYDGKSNCTWVY